MKKSSAIFLFITIFLFSCKKEEPPVQRTTRDVFEDFQKIDIKEGIQDIELEVSNGIFWSFRVIAPKIEPDKQYPLVMALHWATNKDPNIHKTTDCYIEPGFENQDVFIISPNGGAEIWSHIKNQEMVVNLTNFALLTWPINPDNTLLTGYSNGGNGSWFFGETQSNLFTASIPMATSYTTIHSNGTTRKMPIPMYVIHGEKDELFPVAETQEWVEKSNAVGSRLKFVIAKDLTHNQACSYVPYLKDGIKWVQDSVWN